MIAATYGNVIMDDIAIVDTSELISFFALTTDFNCVLIIDDKVSLRG